MIDRAGVRRKDNRTTERNSVGRNAGGIGGAGRKVDRIEYKRQGGRFRAGWRCVALFESDV